MEAGKLRHRLTFQINDYTRATDGGVVETWKDLGTVWGSIRPLNGEELWQARQLQAEVTHEVTIRHTAGWAYSGSTVAPSPKHRIQFGTRYFDIHAVMNVDERSKTLRLLCSEAVT